MRPTRVGDDRVCESMKIIIDDKIPYIRPYAEQMGECVYLPGAQIRPEDVRDAQCLIVRTRTHVDRRLLEGSQVEFVATATIGFDHIDREWLARAGVRWTNCPGCNATSVAQYVSPLVPEGSVVGLVGCGNVGRAVRRVLEHRGLRVLVSDPPLGMTDDLSEADVITFHVPLTHDGPYATYHMADDSFFRSLRRHPRIINAARGGVVDEAALLRAMDAGLVSDVVIDTWETEPNPNAELLSRALVATPHIAGYSANGKANATLMSLRAVAEHFGLSLPLPEDALSLLRAHYGELPQTAPYSPFDDSRRLKDDPSIFEQQRGNYPFRLEP